MKDRKRYIYIYIYRIIYMSIVNNGRKDNFTVHEENG